MIATLVRKELSEWFVGGTVGRYGSWEFAVFLLLTGVIMPMFLATTKHSSDPGMMVALCLAVPLLLEVYAVADAYSGEHERGTLEWLYATPISSVHIVLGKWLAAAMYALLLGASALAVATVVRVVLHASVAPPETYAASLAFAIFGAATIGGIATLVAISATSVRSAVSMFNVGFVAVVLVSTQGPTIASTVARWSGMDAVTRSLAQFPPLVSVGAVAVSIAAACLIIATKTVDRKRTA